ncbi:sugar O-acetyltransferase [Pararoseomonas sp. SCSIO 73927]|uniref:sugar O-acetyltransferase n=1 Tax=Pararoseomonas sp. SCSIO 73927 TaxID=3114537 RepID=UPI0030CF1D89
MTEREKMLAGLPYNGMDPDLLAARYRARALVLRMDALPPEDEAARRAVLEELLGGIGAKTMVMPGFRCDYGGNIRIGADAYVNFNCVFLDCAPITLGDGCQVAPSVQIYTATHPLEPGPRAAGIESAHPVTIGRNVWLGGGCIVLPGVTIGDDTVVGAGAVVNRDLPAGVLAVGNPARVVRRLGGAAPDQM